jgi:hypothetical protein
MPLSIIVTHRDGSSQTGKIWPSTEIAFERHYKMSWIEAFSKDSPFQEYIYFAAHHALHEDGHTDLEFDAWTRTIASIELEADPANPTDPARPPG